tara:strand:- start:1173 stop:1505 length:333 start_codon:yes stop_codon:yes gene_type:complete
MSNKKEVIWNSMLDKYMTFGKSYEVIQENDCFYVVIDDARDEAICNKSYFKDVPTPRKKPIIILIYLVAVLIVLICLSLNLIAPIGYIIGLIVGLMRPRLNWWDIKNKGE